MLLEDGSETAVLSVFCCKAAKASSPFERNALNLYNQLFSLHAGWPCPTNPDWHL